MFRISRTIQSYKQVTRKFLKKNFYNFAYVC